MIGAYAGLRPLIDTGEGRTADVSRDHAVVESPSGVISVIGGKLTEYRHMAEDVLDRAVALRGAWRQARAGPATCRWSERRPIPGSTVRRPPDLPVVAGGALRGGGAQRDRHADLRAADRPGRRRNRRHPSGFEYAVTHEGALTVDDILDRRTRIGLVAADRDAGASTSPQEFADSRWLSRRIMSRSRR